MIWKAKSPDHRLGCDEPEDLSAPQELPDASLTSRGGQFDDGAIGQLHDDASIGQRTRGIPEVVDDLGRIVKLASP